jgi:malate synthase
VLSGGGEDGRAVDKDLYLRIRDQELARLGGSATGELGTAAALLDRLVLADDLADFFTLEAYKYLD